MNKQRARAFFRVTAPLFLLAAFVHAVDGCTPWQRQAARSVVDASTVACLLANAALPDDRIRQVCGIVDALDGPLKDLLSAHRERVARAEAHGNFVGAMRCQIERGPLERLERDVDGGLLVRDR